MRRLVSQMQASATHFALQALVQMASFLAMLIAPSILSADFANLATELQSIKSAGADWVHVDVMDGHFVPNLTIGAPVVKALRRVTDLPLDVHLMISRPDRYAEDFIKAGADYLTFHIEAEVNAADLLRSIRQQGVKAGLTLKPGTSVDEVIPLLPLTDLLLVMTVEPGFGGQKFMMDQVSKIKRIRSEINKLNLSTLIEVDGGINDQTAQHCLEADVLVAGQYIFTAPNRADAIQSLKV